MSLDPYKSVPGMQLSEHSMLVELHEKLQKAHISKLKIYMKLTKTENIYGTDETDAKH
jgi:hypothetical protein